jgi:hypothetical protein
VTVVSYMDRLYWGLIACREAVPGLWDLAEAIPEALDELLNPPARAARKKTKAAARRKPAPRKKAAVRAAG